MGEIYWIKSGFIYSSAARGFCVFRTDASVPWQILAGVMLLSVLVLMNGLGDIEVYCAIKLLKYSIPAMPKNN